MMIISKISCFYSYFLFYLLVGALQGQHYRQTTDCRTRNNKSVEYICRIITECRYASNLIKNNQATTCGYEKRNEKYFPKICCPETRKPSTTKPSTHSPNHVPKPTTKKTPVPVKNPIAVVKAMCNKYSEASYTEVIFPPLLPGQNPTITRKFDCANVNSFIVNGEKAVLKEFPHMALIGYGDDDDSINWQCGGSLISEKFVLTAAHCSDTPGGSAKWVRLGELDYLSDSDSATPFTLRITERIVHPNYKESSVYHDIALFKLEKEVKFDSYVRPICLHTVSTITDFKKPLVVSGWGITGAGETQSSELLKANVSFATYEKCRPAYESDSRLSNGVDDKSMICALDVSGRDSCTGDSGGPMQIYNEAYEECMWDQIGIISFGSSFCGDKMTPAIYTKVANYIDWIQKHVWP